LLLIFETPYRITKYRIRSEVIKNLSQRKKDYSAFIGSRVSLSGGILNTLILNIVQLTLNTNGFNMESELWKLGFTRYRSKNLIVLHLNLAFENKLLKKSN